MSFSQFPWENRVFRVDRECYLLFLGMDELDEKPFVRIGNSSWLNEKVLEVISHTVITESFTGNPFGEVGLTHHYKGLYLGEPRIVEVIKSFFDRFHVKEPEVITYSEQEEREGRDHVYFYNTGNIVVTFDKIRLFDLYAREKSDRHYNYYCSEILNIFRKNPLKWETHNLKGKGFFLTDESFFFYDTGRLLGLKWDKNYFKILAKAGWDPDKLEGILVTLKQEEMEGDKSAGITNYIKRGIAAKNPMTFFSTDKTFSSKIEPLFEYVRSRSVPIKFKDISQKGQFEWHGTQGECNESYYTFTLSSNITASLQKDGRLILDYQGVERSCRPLKNVPSRIHTDMPALQEIDHRYVEDISQALLKSGLTGNAARFVREAALVTSAIRQGADEHSNNLSVPLEKQYSSLKKTIRSLGKEGGERIALLASNCAELLELISEEKSGLSEEAQELSSLLRKHVSAPTGEGEGFLFTANYYNRGCFYLPFKLDISPGDRTKAAEMQDALIRCDKKEVEFFFSERSRLEEILRSLNDGTLWEEMKKATSTADKNSSRESTVVENKSPGQGESAQKNTAQGTTAQGTTAQNSQSSWQGKKRKFRWGILLLILLLAGLLSLGADYFIRGDKSLVSRVMSTMGSSGSAGSSGSMGSSGSAGSSGSSENKTTLSDEDSKIVPGEKESDKPQIVFEDDGTTKVLKPFVMDEDFLSDFSVNGIPITMADIHLKANAVAVMNGYRDLGFNRVTGKDPTIIEPGLVLDIPGNLTYTVRTEDNIWYIAARLLESELRAHTAQFDKLVKGYDERLAIGESGEKELDQIRVLEKESNCENFRIKVQNWFLTIKK